MRRFDDPEKLLDQLRIAPEIERLEDVEVEGYGPSWEVGQLCVAKNYRGFEIHDLLRDLTPDDGFRKVPFDYPKENLCGFALVLSYDREGDRVYEVVAGWVPSEREQLLDEWTTRLNASIKASHAARSARWAPDRRVIEADD